MNDQYNNYNSQFNNQPPVSNGGSPTKPSKRKFFTSSIMDEVNVDAVGGTTSGNVVSWSAGGQKTASNSSQNQFAQQTMNTGASNVGNPLLNQQQMAMPQLANTMGIPTVAQTNTMEMPVLVQNNVVSATQPLPILPNQVPINQTPIQQSVPQVQTNSLGLALAEPETSTPQKVDDSIEMLSEVNGDVYVEEPEILDFDDDKAKNAQNSGIKAPEPPAQAITAPTLDNSSSYLAEKFHEQQQFEKDQLSQGNFSNLMGNNSSTTFAPGMSKAEASTTTPIAAPVIPAVPTPVVPVAPVAAVSEAAAPVLNAISKPDLGVVPTQSNANAYDDSLVAGTPIFQAATEVLDETPIQGQSAIAPQFQNAQLENWVNEGRKTEEVDTNSYSGVAKKEEPVKEDKKLSKKLRKKKTEPVPEEVTKKDEGHIRVDNMASAIVGSKYTQLVMSPFNFAALFVGPAYMAYRRMPLAAIVVYLIQVAVIFFVPTFAPNEYYTLVQFGVIIGFALLFALSVNRMIIANAKFKAKSIVRKYGENGPKDEATIMAQRMGRPSIVMALLFLILSGVISSLLLTTVFKDSRLGNLYNLYITTYQNGGTMEYNGYIKHSNYDVSSAITIKVPDGFTSVKTEGLSGESNMKYTYITDSDGRYNDCTFDIYAVDRFINGDTFIRKMAEFNGALDTVTNKEINGIDWTNYYTEDSMYKIYYRGFT